MSHISVASNTLRELYTLLDYEDGLTLTHESEEVDGFRTVASCDDCETRWMKLYRLIIRRVEDDQLFSCEYAIGLTEMQPNEFPWESAKFVKCQPVRAKTQVITKVITTYVAI